ncbi:MAG: hypothetical protein ACXADY_04015 [Candidatus Hodarchaeales archaeon]|jgi:hypothetical protein
MTKSLDKSKESIPVNPILLLDFAKIIGYVSREETNSHHVYLAEIIFDILKNTFVNHAETKIAAFLSEVDGIDEPLDVHRNFASVFISMYENYNPDNPESQLINIQQVPVPLASPVKFHRSKRKEYLYLITLLIFLWLFINTFLCYGIIDGDFNLYISYFLIEGGLVIAILAIVASLYKEETKQFIRMLIKG